MARILEDDDIFVFGTAGNDTIVTAGQAGRYSLYGRQFFGAEIHGGKGNDDINPGIAVHRDSIIMVFGGNNAHDTRLPERFDIDTPRAFSGNDVIHVGQNIWGDGEDGRDTYFSHGPSSFGEFMPRVWMDWKKDDLVFDNSDKSHDRAREVYRADGSGVWDGFELVNIRFERTFTSKAGIDYAEVNGFTVHSFARSPAIREQFTDALFYDKGDDPDHAKLYVRYDPDHETPRQAVAEFAHDHAVAGADQFLF